MNPSYVTKGTYFSLLAGQYTHTRDRGKAEHKLACTTSVLYYHTIIYMISPWCCLDPL